MDVHGLVADACGTATYYNVDQVDGACDAASLYHHLTRSLKYFLCRIMIGFPPEGRAKYHLVMIICNLQCLMTETVQGHDGIFVKICMVDM